MAANPMVELGVSGLKHQGGKIDEEWLRKLQGDRAVQIFREMADNDDVVGSVLFVIEHLIRRVRWRVDPFSQDPVHQDQAEFIASLMNDMSHTWADLISEILSMLVYGWSSLEIVYKRREGPFQKDPKKRSKHSDGLIGWRKLPLRSQDTLERWEMDEDGGIKGWWQEDPNTSGLTLLPIEKLLHFRTTSRKNNPEGRSILRNAYVAWYRKKHIAESEAIGIERDLAGIPMFMLPPEYFDPAAPAEVQAQLAVYKQIVENIRQDEMAGLCLPWLVDEEGRDRIKFELIGSGGSRLFDTSAIIERYDRRIAMTVAADFVMLGHERVGSLALADNKTSMFATALGAWLQSIAETLNRHGVSRIYELNGWDPSEAASFVPGDIEERDVQTLAAAVSQLVLSGGLVLGPTDEVYLRQATGLPEKAEGE